MVLQYFYSSEYSLMFFGETWKCKVWMHSSGKFANSSEFNVTSTDGMIRLRFKLMSFKIDGIIFFKKFSKLSRISLRVFSPSGLLKSTCNSSNPSNFSSHTERRQSSKNAFVDTSIILDERSETQLHSFQNLTTQKSSIFSFQIIIYSKICQHFDFTIRVVLREKRLQHR